MHAIVAAVRPQVKPAPSQHFTDAEFASWCRQQWDAVEPIDDGTACPDDQLFPPVAEPESFTPSPVQEAELAGFVSGTHGGKLTVSFAFDVELYDAIHDGRAKAFAAGRIAGLHVHARKVGYDVGRLGDDCERPASISSRFAASFEAGWRTGMYDWSIAAEDAALDSTDDYDRWQQREDAERDADARFHDIEVVEAGGWYRSVHV